MRKKVTQWSQGLAILAGTMCLVQASAQAADRCDVTVDATEAMTFSTKEIAVPKR